LIAVLHANYGAGYLWALNEIAKPEEIEKHAGIDFNKFKQEIVDIQDSTTKKLIIACPEFAPKNGYLLRVGGEGL
jgi:hypothetical protein